MNRPYKKNDAIRAAVKNSDAPVQLTISEFIPESEMAQLLGSADYAIFWFDDSVLTSSGVILSLSYGLPVICRRIPTAEKIRDGVNGYLFDTADDLQE